MNQNQPDNQGSDQSQNTGFTSGFNNSNFGGTNFGGNGDFNSGFGGGTNAVSQIFKEGSFTEGEKRKKLIIIGAAVASIVVSVGSLWWIFNEQTAETPAETASIAPPSEIAPPAAATNTAEAAVAAAIPEIAEPTEPAAAAATVGNSDSFAYNEEKGGVDISVKAGTHVEVARDKEFGQMYVHGVAKTGSFRIPNPPPGEIFWREQGSGTVNVIKVSAPAKLGLTMNAPANLAPASEVSWSGSGSAAYYRLEFATDNGFSNVATAFTTQQTRVAAKGVTPGKYFVRVGGYNKASGKWEFTRGSAVQVQ